MARPLAALWSQPFARGRDHGAVFVLGVPKGPSVGDGERTLLAERSAPVQQPRVVQLLLPGAAAFAESEQAPDLSQAAADL